MIHYLDIPRAVKAEHEGTILCRAKNIMGECETTCQLKLIPKLDYKSVLKVSQTEEPESIAKKKAQNEKQGEEQSIKIFNTNQLNEISSSF